MSEQDEIILQEKICRGLEISYEKLLRRKAALGQDMVFADENGMPRVVPAKEALADYLKTSAEPNTSKHTACKWDRKPPACD